MENDMKSASIVTACICALVFAVQIHAADIEAYPIPLTQNIGIGKMSHKLYVKRKPVTKVIEFKIPKQVKKELLLTAPRNGFVNGQILMIGKKDTVTTSAIASDLKGPSGKVLSAKNIQILYGQYYYQNLGLHVYKWKVAIASSDKCRGISTRNGEFATPPPKKGYWMIDPLLPEKKCVIEKVLPRTAWVKIFVPADTKPGLYTGEIRIAGGPAVPLKLDVVNAAVPPIDKSPMVNYIRPAWEIIARGNGIPEKDFWKSDEFWKMVETYLQLLRDLRMPICHIGAFSFSYPSFQGMVKWTKKGEEWEADFTTAEKFLDVYKKTVGEPLIVSASGFRTGYYTRSELQTLYYDADKKEQALITLADTSPEAMAVADRLVAGLMKALAKYGWEKKLSIAVFHDKQSRKDEVRKKLLEKYPGLKITAWSHSNRLGGDGLTLDRISLLVGKINTSNNKTFPYHLVGSMRDVKTQNYYIPLWIWEAPTRGLTGYGFINFASWSRKRTPRHFKFYNAAPFGHGITTMVYPLYEGKVVTGAKYEIFREFCQVYEIMKQMQAKKKDHPEIKKLVEWTTTLLKLPEGKYMYLKHDLEVDLPKLVDEKHRALLKAAAK
jgi:hypothetical protein